MGTSQKMAVSVMDALNDLYPHSSENMNFLFFENPYELLIMTILSAQTTDANVNSIRKDLFRRYPSPFHLGKADVKEVEQVIYSTGFYRSKAKNIIETSQLLCSVYEGNVPCSMEALLTLPGVGRKTANIVLNHGFGHVEGIAVDTHVSRLSQRLGFSENTEPEKIEKDLMNLFPEKYWAHINYLLIRHGREICLARNPKCELCSVRKMCHFYKNGKSKKSANEKKHPFE